MSYRYLYGTNRLQKVIKNGIDTVHYSCDERGNISGGYGELGEYNYQNLPLEMLNDNSELYNYSYNSNGKRISKTSNGSGEYYLNDYLGREFAIYDKVAGELKEVNIFGNGLVGKVIIDDEEDENNYYYSKDHLGSIRVVMSDKGEVTSAQDYYPYGELLREYNSASQRYQFTEKEKDNESSYLHFDARTLDPSLPMWLQVDPLAEKYPGWSPYNYTLCNPLRYIDPKGMMTYKVNGIEYDYDVWYGLAEPFIQDAEKKEKEKKAEEEKKENDFNFWTWLKNALGITGAKDDEQDEEETNVKSEIDKSVAEFQFAAFEDFIDKEKKASLLALEFATMPLQVATFNKVTGISAKILRYPADRAGGLGFNIYKNNSRIISFDFHRIGKARVFRPHIDIPPLGIRHWPFNL